MSAAINKSLLAAAMLLIASPSVAAPVNTGGGGAALMGAPDVNWHVTGPGTAGNSVFIVTSGNNVPDWVGGTGAGTDALPAGSQWAADDAASFFLNGKEVSNLVDHQSGKLTAFVIPLALLSDLNTVNVKVSQAISQPGLMKRRLAKHFRRFRHNKNYTGLLVAFSPIAPVPLPPAMLLFGSAIIGMSWLKRRADKARRPIGFAHEEG